MSGTCKPEGGMMNGRRDQNGVFAGLADGQVELTSQHVHHNINVVGRFVNCSNTSAKSQRLPQKSPSARGVGVSDCRRKPHQQKVYHCW